MVSKSNDSKIPNSVTSSSPPTINSLYSVEGRTCTANIDSDRVGYSKDYSSFVFLHCLLEGRWFNLSEISKLPIIINQKTGELISAGDFSLNNNIPLKYISTTISDSLPNSLNYKTSGNLPINQCKLSQSLQESLHKGFNYSGKSFIGPNSKIQVIPIQTSDAKAINTPSFDYKEFFADLE